MKVLCNSVNAESLPTPFEAIGYTSHTGLNQYVSKGSTYWVYGIKSISGMLHYLIMPDRGNYPCWLPQPIFDIVDEQIPHHWFFSSYTGPSGIIDFIISYREMCLNPHHHDGLEERNKEDLLLFFEQKERSQL